MSSCGKNTCAPSPRRPGAHDGVGPTVALTPVPTQSSHGLPVQVHKTPRRRSLFSF